MVIGEKRLNLKKFNKGIGIYAALLLGVLIFTVILFQGVSDNDIKYSQVVDYFKNNQVESFTVKNNVLELVLVEGVDFNGNQKFSTPLYNTLYFLDNVSEYIQQNHESGVLKEYDIPQVKDNTIWGSIILYVLLGAGVLFLMFFMMRQMQGGGRAMSFGKSRLRTGDSFKKKVTFNDVAGAAEE